MRRRAVFGSLIFSAIIVLYIIVFGEDTSVNETAVLSAFGLMGAIVASYVGGAVWDDYNMKKISKGDE